MEPPPAPTLRTSRVGTLAGKEPTSVEREMVGSPSRITDTSVDVPPMSNASTRLNPVRRAMAAVLVTPPAGPDSTVWTGRREAASALINPPSERTMCRRAVTPASFRRASMPDR